MKSRVNKWLDLLDRAGWTGVQAAAGAGLDYLTTGDITLRAAGYAVAIAVLKVVIGQRTGDGTGSLIGTPVIEPPPE